MGRYDKYIECEFGYTQPSTSRNVNLTYYGLVDGMRGTCEHCGKELTGKKTVHSFTDDEHGGEWLFGDECVKHVFGTGLVTLKESHKQNR